MTLREFERKALKEARLRLDIPDGWWGEWSDITNGAVRVKRNGLVWTISKRGKAISRHDSRSFAIAKARTPHLVHVKPVTGPRSSGPWPSDDEDRARQRGGA